MSTPLLWSGPRHLHLARDVHRALHARVDDGGHAARPPEDLRPVAEHGDGVDLPDPFGRVLRHVADGGADVVDRRRPFAARSEAVGAGDEDRPVFSAGLRHKAQPAEMPLIQAPPWKNSSTGRFFAPGGA